MGTPTDLTNKRARSRAAHRESEFEVAAKVVEVFDGYRLTQARQLKALTKRALADFVGVSPAAIGQYEASTIKPRPESALRMAEILEVPVRFFAFDPTRARAQLDVSTAHFRSLRSMRSGERERAVAFVSQIWELCNALERRVRLPNVDLPGWEGSEVVPEVPNHPAAAARAIRKQWGLGSKPVPHVVRLLESKGIIVTVLPFSEAERVNAFSTSRLTRPIVVLTTDRNDVYRHRFSAAHELGHLVMHGDAQPGDAEHERAANMFAAEFLTPSAALAPLLPARVDFSKYAKLQAMWGVSVQSLLYRSRELGMLGDASYRRAFQRLASLQSSGIIRTEPIEHHAGENPVMLSRALSVAAKSGVLSIEKLADELALYVESLTKYMPDSSDLRPQVSVVDFQEARRARELGTLAPADLREDEPESLA